MVLQRGGHEPVAVGTVSEAEAALAEHGEVEGMLLDLHLGGGHSGVSVVADWARSGQLAPFLVVTGTPEHPSLAELEGQPLFRGVLAKPFPLDELQRRVQELPVEADEPEA